MEDIKTSKKKVSTCVELVNGNQLLITRKTTNSVKDIEFVVETNQQTFILHEVTEAVLFKSS